jgi:hypothetical protein
MKLRRAAARLYRLFLPLLDAIIIVGEAIGYLVEFIHSVNLGGVRVLRRSLAALTMT